MEGDRPQKHRCKVCRKSFPSGRSLGGHMRSHMAMNSSPDVDERPQPIRNFAGLGAGYGLRENPKKTWRISDCIDDYSSKGEKLCRVCGKEFLSWKALFGHMRCHSDRVHRASAQEGEQEPEQEGSWSNGGNKVGSESLSDTDVTAMKVPRKRRRSMRKAPIPSSSLSVSEYEQDEEDGAISLMMLSRDTSCRGGSHWVAESSDMNSVISEGKGIAEGDGDFVSDGSEVMKAMKLEAERKGSELGMLGNGYCGNGFKKVESDASDDWFDRESEFKKPKVSASDTDDFGESDEKLRKGCSKKDLNSEVSELASKPKSDRGELAVGKYSLIKRQILEAYDAKFGRDYADRLGYNASDVDFDKGIEKTSRFECAACNKTFDSYQALGGHRASHKRMKGCLGSRENSMETDASVDQAAVEKTVDQGLGVEASRRRPSKKMKSHECLICGKVFSSGQALGGHKRSHLVASSESAGNTACQQQSTEEQPLEIPDLLDLNLPAPVDGDSISTNGNAEFEPWWTKTDLKHEPLVGVISN